MTDTAIAGLIPRGSIGLKLLLVCLLVLLMAVPLTMVGIIMAGRQDRAHQVINEISARAGGQQTLGGPVLLVPYTRTVLSQTPQGQRSDVIHGNYLILPTSGGAQANVDVTDRRRGIYRAAVYHADTRFHAEFDPAAAAAGINAADQLDWNSARVVVFAHDARAMRATPTIALAGGAPVEMAAAMDLSVLPASINQASRYIPESDPALQVFAAPASLGAGPHPFSTDAHLDVTGAQRFAIAAFAQNTTVAMHGNRRDVSATGYFQSVDPLQPGAHGFDANWRAPLSANGGRAIDLEQLSLRQLADRDMAVSFVSSDDLYNGVARAISYGILFIGLVFLATLIFEAVSGKKAHPAQYILVGLAQCVFYLLLLSMTEIIGFDGAFLMGAGATIVLLAYYAAASARSASVGAGAFVGLSGLYGAMYVLLTLEDYALLAGSLVAFLAIAATMIATRRIDWYGRTGSVSAAT
ncbi:MAG: cell envelope integrity protein CreD [Terricaulis sp.]